MQDTKGMRNKSIPRLPLLKISAGYIHKKNLHNLSCGIKYQSVTL